MPLDRSVDRRNEMCPGAEPASPPCRWSYRPAAPSRNPYRHSVAAAAQESNRAQIPRTLAAEENPCPARPSLVPAPATTPAPLPKVVGENPTTRLHANKPTGGNVSRCSAGILRPRSGQALPAVPRTRACVVTGLGPVPAGRTPDTTQKVAQETGASGLQS